MGALVLTLLAACSGAGLPGVTRRAVQHRGATWDVFELDLSKIELRLYGQADPTLRTFAAVRMQLARQAKGWAVMTNAGMFHAGGRPVGLHIEAGRQYAPLELANGAGNFYLKPNGVFCVDAQGGHVVASDAYAPRSAVQLATQSGPLLLGGNRLHPSFLPSSHNVAKRSAVGVRDATHVVIAVSRTPVTFYAAATLFAEVLACSDALYLDGTISDFDAPQRSTASASAFGGVLAAVAREPAP
jgi:uncharacterized protein YigE (DUF2233 family)